MTQLKQYILIGTLALAGWSVGFPNQLSVLVAQEFKIETSVYNGNDSLPVSHNVSLFSAEGVVYDFQMSNDAQPHPLEIVIFNPRTRMLVLLDLERKIRLELPELRVTKILEGVRRETIPRQPIQLSS